MREVEFAAAIYKVEISDEFPDKNQVPIVVVEAVNDVSAGQTDFKICDHQHPAVEVSRESAASICTRMNFLIDLV